MIAVTIQSNKIVSKKLKTTKRYWSHPTEKNVTHFGQPNTTSAIIADFSCKFLEGRTMGFALVLSP